MFQYDDKGDIKAVSFCLGDNGTPILLPARHKSLYDLAKNGHTKYIKDENQARRVAWRQIFRWIQAQLAMVQINMVDINEVFLPYIMIDHNKTLFNLIEEKGHKFLLHNGK